MLVQFMGHTDDDIALASATSRARRADRCDASCARPATARRSTGAIWAAGDCTSAIATAFPPDVAWSDGPDGTRQANFRHFVLGYSTRPSARARSRWPRGRSHRRMRRSGAARCYATVSGSTRTSPASTIPRDGRAKASAGPACRRRTGASRREADGPVARRHAPGPSPGSPPRDLVQRTTSATGRRIPTASSALRCSRARGESARSAASPASSGWSRVGSKGTPFGPPREGYYRRRTAARAHRNFPRSSISAQY